MVGFPLLLIPLAVYNIIAFLMPSVSFTDVLFKVPMITGETWPVTLADVLLALGVVLLLLEVVKGARPGSKFLMDHLLSLIVFGAAAAEFVMWPKFATSTYFLMTTLSGVDFLSGLALRTRRRAVAAKAAPAPPPKAAEKAEAPAAEPEPAPAAPAPAAPAAPAAASVAESVLATPPEPKPADHPEPKPATSAAASEEVVPATPSPAVSPTETASPEIPSPGIQPGPGSPASPDKPDTPQR